MHIAHGQAQAGLLRVGHRRMHAPHGALQRVGGGQRRPFALADAIDGVVGGDHPSLPRQPDGDAVLHHALRRIGAQTILKQPIAKQIPAAVGGDAEAVQIIVHRQRNGQLARVHQPLRKLIRRHVQQIVVILNNLAANSARAGGGHKHAQHHQRHNQRQKNHHHRAADARTIAFANQKPSSIRAFF